MTARVFGISVFRAKCRQRVTPFNLGMGFLAAILIATDILLANAVQLRGLNSLVDICPGILFLAVCLAYCVFRSLPKLIEICELAIWAALLFNMLSVLTQIAGRSPRPLVDAGLAAADAHAHFATASVTRLIAHFPLLRILSPLSYIALYPMVIAVLILPPLFGRSMASRRFVLAVVFAAVVQAGVFALWPAAGPWTTEAILPSQDQAKVTDYLMRLKAPGAVTLDRDDSAIVAFPSFHTLLATLAAYALASIRRLRVGSWLLAAMIIISTIKQAGTTAQMWLQDSVWR
jgi:hypothetical protein